MLYFVKKILNWEGTIFRLHWAPQGGDSQNMGGTVRQDHLYFVPTETNLKTGSIPSAAGEK